MNLADKPASTRLDLAAALNDRAVDHLKTGHHNEAVADINEAIALFRGVGRDVQVQLAGALHNQSVIFAEVGRRDEALHAENEAVAIYRGLANVYDDELDFLRATSFSHLAGLLVDVTPATAAAAAEEGVRISRRLANTVADNSSLGETRPNMAADDLDIDAEIVLAMTLHNLSLSLSRLDCHAHEQAAIEEAVSIYRRRAAAHPMWEPRLAQSLDRLGQTLFANGRTEDGLLASQEAVRIYKGLAVHTAAHTPDIAGTLDNLSRHLAQAGDQSAALRASQEAVQAFQKLCEAQPARYAAELERATDTLKALQDNVSPFR